MDDTAVGWIAAIIIGGFAGWLAEKVTRSTMGLLTNIILGMIGAGIAAWLFGLLGIHLQSGVGRVNRGELQSIELFRLSFSLGISKGAGVQFDDIRSQLGGGIDLLRRRLDE